MDSGRGGKGNERPRSAVKAADRNSPKGLAADLRKGCVLFLFRPGQTAADDYELKAAVGVPLRMVRYGEWLWIEPAPSPRPPSFLDNYSDES